MVLNETPVRTSKNFNINNIKLDEKNIPEKIENFNNTKIIKNTSLITIEEHKNTFDLSYGLGEILTNQVKEQANKEIKITIDSKKDEQTQLEFNFNEENKTLVENIEIIAKENTKSTIILKYTSDEEIKAYHNGIINILSKENSELNIIIINLMNNISNNFLSVQINEEEKSFVNLTTIDFGAKNSITNYCSNLKGDLSNNKINTIYLGKQDQTFDLNYIVELRGEKSNVDIDVQGALGDNAKKHFKGTIDFKKGCKKATGNESENCMLLSNTSKSIALPMLLCSEEDVEGNHSSSAGKLEEKELFYIMSRGFNKKEAIKLMVRAKFNKILENIQNENLKNEINTEIDKKLN